MNAQYTKKGLLALALIGWIGPWGCGSSSSESELEHAAKVLCQRFAQCAGTTLGSEEMKMCVALLSASLQILPDPAAFESCIQELTCEQIENDEEAVQQCLDLDPSSIVCKEDDLHACTNQGVCKDIDCHSTCSLIGASFHHCGMDEDKGHDVCWCVM